MKDAKKSIAQVTEKVKASKKEGVDDEDTEDSDDDEEPKKQGVEKL